MADQVSGKHVSPVPRTLESCVVRMADTISYVGRDIEAAIRLGFLERSDLPPDVTRILGDTNGTMVYTMVTDMIHHSFGRNAIAYSDEVSWAIRTLKAFNLERIYRNPKAKQHIPNIRDLFRILFDTFLEDLEKDNGASAIHTGFLARMDEDYLTGTPHAAKVRDFIAGMTDRYFIDQCPENLRPVAVRV